MVLHFILIYFVLYLLILVNALAKMNKQGTMQLQQLIHNELTCITILALTKINQLKQKLLC